MASVISIIEDKIKVSEASIKALQTAQEHEQKLIGKDYRWVKVGQNTKILVPCDKKGNPTKDGFRRISKLADSLHINY